MLLITKCLYTAGFKLLCSECTYYTKIYVLSTIHIYPNLLWNYIIIIVLVLCNKMKYDLNKHIVCNIIPI